MSTSANPASSGLGREQPADSGSVNHRAAPPLDNTNFAAQDPNVVYTQVQAANPAQVGQVAQSWTNIGSALETVDQVLSAGAAAGGSGWTGAAAERALGFHTQVAQWTAVATQAAYGAGGNVSAQSAAAASAKYSMPKPVNYGMSHALADFSANPFGVGPIRDKLIQAQANHQEIAHVVQQYDLSLNQASQQIPALGPTPSFTSSASGGQSSGSVHGGSSGGGVRPVSGGAVNSPAGSVGGVGSQAGSSGSGSGAPVDSGSGTRLSGTGGSGGGSVGSGFDSSGPQSAGLSGGDPVGGGVLPVVPVGGFGGGSGDGSSSGGESGFGAGQAGGVATGAGARSAVGGGSATGGRSAAGAASAAERTAARGAAGQPVVGAGRGRKGDEDQEHHRPAYLVERDPDSIFGVDETTAPPVIGV